MQALACGLLIFDWLVVKCCSTPYEKQARSILLLRKLCVHRKVSVKPGFNQRAAHVYLPKAAQENEGDLSTLVVAYRSVYEERSAAVPGSGGRQEQREEPVRLLRQTRRLRVCPGTQQQELPGERVWPKFFVLLVNM